MKRSLWKKRGISLLLFGVLLVQPMTIGCAAGAANTVEPVINATVVNRSVHIAGRLPQTADRFATVQLLSGGQRPTTAQAVQDTVLHFGMTEVDGNGSFSYDFSIASLTGKEYLYVKSGEAEYLQPLTEQRETVRLYVSPSGNDAAAGTQSAPLKTLEGAKKAVAKQNRDAVNVEVLFQTGEYFLDKQVNMTAAESGGPNTTVTYKAAEGAKPVFTGSKKLTASRFRPVTDKAILERLPETARGKTLQLDLTQDGIRDYDVKLYSRTNNLLNERGLLLNGKPQRIARYPNTGFLRISEGGKVIKAGSNTEAPVFQWSDDYVKRWGSAGSFWLEGFFKAEYRVDTAADCTVNAETNQITMNKAELGIDSTTRWRAINLLEELDIPGEWYIDAKTMTLYYYPPYYFNPADDELRYTVDSGIICLDGAKNIRFENLEFRDKYYGSLIRTVSGQASGITVASCTFANTASAVDIKGRNNTVDSCDFYNLQGMAAKLTDPDALFTLTQSGNAVTNNYIYNTDLGDAPVFVGGVGTRVEHNLIHRTDDGGIKLCSVDPVFYGAECSADYNEVYNCLREKGDMSVIYTGRSWFSPGTKIRYNYLHDFGANEQERGRLSNRTYGIFADDTFSGVSHVGNLIVTDPAFATYGIVVGGGSNVENRGNTIVGTTNAASLNDRTRFTNIKNYGAYMAMQTVIGAGLDISAPPWSTKYPEVKALWEELQNSTGTIGTHIPKNETLIGNLYYNSGAPEIDARNKSNGTFSGDVTAADASVFVNAAKQDWRVTAAAKSQLSIGAEVLDETFDLNQIGLQRTLSIDYEPVRLLYPLSGDAPSANAMTLTWEEAFPADEYGYEIATDAAFTNIVKSGTVYESIANVTGLQTGTAYYWRVTARNLSRVYEKSWTSAIGSFRTAAEILTGGSVQKNAQGGYTLSYCIDGAQTGEAAVVVLIKNDDTLLHAAVYQDPIVQNTSNFFTKTLASAAKPGCKVEWFALTNIQSLVPLDRKNELILEE